MANSLEFFKKYTQKLDEVYKLGSLTSVLDSDASLAQEGANANEIKIPKLDMDGMADYSRTDGYQSGAVNLTMETVKFNYDRGRRFSVEEMDDEETAGIAFGRLASEFIRLKVVPELDAFRFASYAKGAAHTKAEDLADGAALLKAILDAGNVMDEAEIPEEGRYLFITPTLYNSVKALDTSKSREALEGFAQIVKIPQSRFYSQIDLLDGKSSGEEAGGFKPTADTGKKINFQIIHKSAVMQYTKHRVNKIITPAENQTGDFWLFFFRSYGLTATYENKRGGIYLHTAA